MFSTGSFSFYRFFFLGTLYDEIFGLRRRQKAFVFLKTFCVKVKNFQTFSPTRHTLCHSLEVETVKFERMKKAKI